MSWRADQERTQVGMTEVALFGAKRGDREGARRCQVVALKDVACALAGLGWKARPLRCAVGC